jgi:hypothetical protein
MVAFRPSVRQIGLKQVKLVISQFVSSHQDTSLCVPDASFQHILGHRW